jgi:hypothetical protein
LVNNGNNFCKNIAKLEPINDIRIVIIIDLGLADSILNKRKLFIAIYLVDRSSFIKRFINIFL